MQSENIAVGSEKQAFGSPTTLNIRPRANAHGQRAAILELLREAGEAGVSRATLIFLYHMSQSASRIFELRKLGFRIRTEDRGDPYVWYVLLEPEPRLNPRPNADWYTRATGRERPKEADDDLPLFNGVRQ